MAKKTNDIIEEQRKSREEFLNLKKMQKGEINAPPKPSETAVMPKTFTEKWENFWFHYKWHTIAVIFITIAIAIIITQCTTRTKYDLKLVFFTYNPVLESQIVPIAEYFENYAEDTNKDGEINVQILNCSLSNGKSDTQYKNSIYSKIQSLIVADPSALLFITDQESIEYFKIFENSGGIFESTTPLPENFYEKIGATDSPENLSISCRRIKGTVLENSREANETYKVCQKLLINLK